MKFKIAFAGQEEKNVYPTGKTFRSQRAAQLKLQDFVQRGILAGVPVVIIESN